MELLNDGSVDSSGRVDTLPDGPKDGTQESKSSIINTEIDEGTEGDVEGEVDRERQERRTIGIYTPRSRKERIERFLRKREQVKWMSGGGLLG